jgi:hypothetical protein
VDTLEAPVGASRTRAQGSAGAKDAHARVRQRGEFSYLGQNYRLKIVRDTTEPLRFDGKHFWLAAEARSEAEAHFRHWYICTGRDWLRERTTALAR